MTTKMIPLKNIAMRPGNREKLDSAELAELAASMKVRQLQPVIVQPHPKKRDTYELLAGERRVRAAMQLEWPTIEAKLFADLTPSEAANIRLAENVQRVNLTPWEEAQHLEEFWDATPGARVEDVADMVGMTTRRVAMCRAIGKLIPELKALVREQNWPLSHLPLLARIPVERQPAILAAIIDNQKMEWRHFDGKKEVPEVPSLTDLCDFLSDYERMLTGAAWKLADAELLPKAGACSECHKRTSAQVLLFADLADPKNDRCLDEGCWMAKQAALVAINVQKLHDKGKTPVLLKEYDSQKVSEELTHAIGPAEVEPAHKYYECKKSEPGAIPAVIVAGDRAGTIKYVKPHDVHENGNGNGNGKAPKPIDQETGKPEPPSTAERMRSLKLKRQCRAVEIWAEKMSTLTPRFNDIGSLLVYFGTAQTAKSRDSSDWEAWAKRDKDNIDAMAWAQLLDVFQERVKRLGTLEDGEGLWAEASVQAAALFQSELLKFCWRDAVTEIPLPKVLAKETDDVEPPTAILNW